MAVRWVRLSSMPVNVDLRAPSLYFMRAFGVVTVDEVCSAIDGMLADPNLKTGAAMFIDNREVTSTRTVEEVAAITSWFGKLFNRGVKRVAVLTDRELDPSKVFAAFASTLGAEVKVFRDEVTARRWLAPEASK